MGNTRRTVREWLTWCWRCGREFVTSRRHARHCGPKCRQQAARLIRDNTFHALVYPFRFGPKAGRASPVMLPQNLERMPYSVRP